MSHPASPSLTWTPASLPPHKWRNINDTQANNSAARARGVVRGFASRKNRCTESKHLLAGYETLRFMIEITQQKFGDVVEGMGRRYRRKWATSALLDSSQARLGDAE